jgi:scyllo-inositol 2-dehydrogenase (NADP+)
MAVSVGLVGFGLAGHTLHAPLIAHAGMNITGVVTRQVQKAQEALPSARVVANLNELLQIEALDLVVIATPSGVHPAQAIAALRSGKHVVVDKPLALTTREADQILSVAEESARKLTVFQNRRWDSDFLTLRRVLADGTLGELNSYEARWDRFRPQVVDRWREHPQEGGGVLYDLGPHLVDQALCLFGMPDWLQADVFAQRVGAQVDDGFEIRLGMGPLRMTLGTRSVVPEHSMRYRLHGSGGSLMKAGLDPQEAQLRLGMSPLDPLFGIEPASQCAQLFSAETGATRDVPSERGDWLGFYRRVRMSIEGGDPVPVLVSEVRQVVQVIEAASRSSEEGRRVYFPV